MKRILRPSHNDYRKAAWLVFLVAGVCLTLVPGAGQAQTGTMVEVFEDPIPLLVHGSSQGYLGVCIADVDADRAQALKLKEVRGAVITLIDHDAPAGQVGLKVNDVVLGVNGQNVDGADQLRKMLKEIPAGHAVSLEISRDGNIQTLAVQLADRKLLRKDVWDKIDNDSAGVAPVAGMGILAGGGGDAPIPGGFHLPLFIGNLNVGAQVEPLTAQMSEYLGVSGGLMVKQVTRKSEAAVAGFHAFDVILKVGADFIATSADWERSLRSNQGKPVPVTILRDKKQQVLTLQVDSKHRQGAVERPNVNPAAGEMMARDGRGQTGTGNFN